MKQFGLTLLLSFLIIPLLLAQERSFLHYTKEDGLPSTQIYDLIQDKEGYIWISTDQGVVKFDGYEFRHFSVKDGLANNDVWKLYENGKGQMWLASFGEELSYIESDEVHSIFFDSTRLAVNTPFVEDGNGEFYVKRVGGMYMIGDTLKRSSDGWTNVNFYFNLLKVKEDRKYWFFGESIRYYENEQLAFATPQKEVLKSLYDWTLLGDYYIYWVNEKMYSFDLNRRVHQDVEMSDLFEDWTPNKRLIYLDNYFWKYGNELIQLNENLEVVERYRDLGNINFHKVFKDMEENLWFITLDDGVYCLPVQSKNTINYQTADLIKTLYYDDWSNTLFFGTSDFDLSYLKDGIVQNIALPTINQKTRGNFRAITSDDSNRLFAGINYSSGGLLVLDIEQILAQKGKISINTKVQKTDYSSFDLAGNPISRNYNHLPIVGAQNSLFWNKKNNHLILSTGQYLSVGETLYTFNSWYAKHSFKAEGLAMLDNQLYAGLEGGLFYKSDYREGIKLIHLFEDNKAVRNILSLEMSKDSILWIGTNGRGIMACKNCNAPNSALKLLPETDGDIIFTLKQDKENNLWAGTNNGLKKITITSWQPFEYDISSFMVSNGLISNAVNSFDLDGENLYVGTDRGLTVLNQADFTKNTAPPLTHITNMRINESDTILVDRYILPHYKNDISIRYVGLSFKSNQRITYKYRVDGIDLPNQWKTTTTLEKEFLNTAPGIYTFRVKAVDANGIESKEALIHFWIKKPWWSSLWFIFCAVLGVLLLLWRILNARIDAIEAKAAKEQEIAKKLAELELRALQAQMNPHFISNALTSIQNYILTKSKYEASQYLSTFSHLMRLFLDASIEKYISLEKEIELLRGYIELESLRFPDQFDVVWNIDKSVDTSLEFPSMLLQPFVENAINYGLIHKKTKGCLTLSFRIEGEFLICLIEDDGIGRERANAMKAASYKSYKSRGMMLVEERLNVLRQIESVESSYVVEDKDPDCEDCGTSVTVTIPLLY